MSVPLTDNPFGLVEAAKRGTPYMDAVIDSNALICIINLDLEVVDVTPRMAAFMGYKSVEQVIGQDMVHLVSIEEWPWLPWTTPKHTVLQLSAMIEEALEIGASHRAINYVTVDQHAFKGHCSVYFDEANGLLSWGFFVGDTVNSTDPAHAYGTVSITANGDMVGTNGGIASQADMSLLQMYLSHDRDTCLEKLGVTARTFERKIRAIAERAGFETTTDLVRALALGLVRTLPRPHNTMRIHAPIELLNDNRKREGTLIHPESLPQGG